MIGKSRCTLYDKTENHIVIYVRIWKNGRIKTYWRRKKKENYTIRYEKGKEFLHKLKANGCAICGYNKYDDVLDFHHVNPQDKKFSLDAAEMNRKDEKIIKELNKCVLLCKNCHAEIHVKERRYKLCVLQ